MVMYSDLAFERVVDPRGGRPGALRGSYRRYRWELSFQLIPSYAAYGAADDAHMPYTFSVTLLGRLIYSATNERHMVPLDVLGDEYLRELAAELLSTYLEEGPAV